MDTKFEQLLARAKNGKANKNEVNDLAIAYDNGDGCTQNYEEALSWMKKAAFMGHEIACVTLGIVLPDETESLLFLNLATNFENAQAYLLLAKNMLKNKHFEYAHDCFLKAKKLGDYESPRILSWIEESLIVLKSHNTCNYEWSTTALSKTCNCKFCESSTVVEDFFRSRNTFL